MQLENLQFNENELHRFESLGDNCEFGMVLRALGSEKSGAFRWALAKIPATIEAIKTDFSGLFEKDNMVPHSKIMIRDVASGIAYHTDMRSSDEDGNLRFNDAGEVWDKKYDNEKQKFIYLNAKFQKRLRDDNTIFIVKGNYGIPQDQIRELHQTLCDKAGLKVKLVHVQKRMQIHKGDFHKVGANVAVGYIDRFAPYRDANDSLKSQWHSIMRQSLEAFKER